MLSLDLHPVGMTGESPMGSVREVTLVMGPREQMGQRYYLGVFEHGFSDSYSAAI